MRVPLRTVTIALPSIEPPIADDLAAVRLGIDALQRQIAHLMPRLLDADPAGLERRGGMVAQLLRERKLRVAMFPSEACEEAAWSVILELAASEHVRRTLSVSGACSIALAPPTTVLRHIVALERAGLVEREPDRADRRRRWLRLTHSGRELLAAYLAAIVRTRQAA